MPNFLFWNLYGKQRSRREIRSRRLLESLTRIVSSREIDFLIFAECMTEPDVLQRALDSAATGSYHRVATRASKTQVWTRWPKNRIAVKYDSIDRLTVFEIELPRSPNLLLMTCHLPDRSSQPTEADRQDRVSRHIVPEIRRIEDFEGHSRSVLVGDLNMDPYEAGMVAASGLNSMMTRILADSMSNSTTRSGSRCFYNPMWSLFGDRSGGPSGSTFWARGTGSNHFWQMYDQVLLRPQVADALLELQLIDTDGADTFVTKQGRPRKALWSDHLPLYFRLNDVVYRGPN